MSKSISISPKHGLNPSITKCFWCGNDIGVAIMGCMKNDEQAPKYIYTDYEPCDDCKTKMDQGITFMEASTSPIHPNQPCMQPNVYPTGRTITITENACKHIIQDKNVLNTTLKMRKAFLDKQTFNEILRFIEK